MGDNNTELSEKFNFSIQDTLELGSASAKLLNNLVAPETSTTSPEDVTVIAPKTTEKTTTVKPAVKKDEKGKKDDTVEKPKSLEDRLFGEDESSEDEEETSSAEKKKPIKKEETPDDNEEENGEEVETSRYSALSKDLLKLGVFTTEEGEEEEEISTPEQLLNRFNEEKKKGAISIVNNFIGQFGEDYQNAFNAIFYNGVNPKDYFTTHNEIQNLSELDLTKEQNQQAVVRQFLRDQELPEEDIDKEIERMSQYGDLDKNAERYHKVLVKKQSAKLEQLENESKLKLEKQKADKQQYLHNVTTVLQNKIKEKGFDGIPVNPSLAQEVHDFLVTEKYKTPSGETLTDFDVAILNLKKPENHERKVKLGLLLKILEKDPTLSTIQKTAITKKTEELFSEVQKHSKKPSKTVTKSNNDQPNRSWF